MSTTSFLSESEIQEIGFKSVGKHCLISRYARFYGASNMVIGDNVRIDDFCILSGNITLGSHIHISAYVALYGAMGIELEDYTGVSPKSVVYSAMDDFSGEFLVGPVHPKETTNVEGGLVTIGKYAQIGSNTVVLPNLSIGEGTVVGACSMVNKDCEEWSVYYGVPARKSKKRKKNMLKFIGVGGKL